MSPQLSKTIEERTQEYQTSHSDIEEGSREQFLIGKAYYDGATDQDPISRADQQKIDTEKFLSLLDKAIEEWNEPHRHQSYVIDKEGALRRFKKAMEE